MKSILSLYSNSKSGYVSLLKNKEIFSQEMKWSDLKTQSLGLLILIEKLIKKLGENFENTPIETIIAPTGPFSFTTVRVTLTIAKSLQFSYPKSKIFSPNNFQVLSFCAYDNLPINQEFFVLIDAFNNGFYWTLMKFENEKKFPITITTPQFSSVENSIEIFSKYSLTNIVSDFGEDSKCNKIFEFGNFNVINSKINFAEKQIELYEYCDFQDKDLSKFSPLYVHTPNFKKL